MVVNTNHTIKCDLCHGEFRLERHHLKEVQGTLNKEGFAPHEATLTFLECPRCGKKYIVALDDVKTLALVEKLRSIAIKQYKLAKMGKPSAELEKKYKNAEWKLGFARQKLAEKYYGSLYQLGDTTEQLDYRYRTR